MSNLYKLAVSPHIHSGKSTSGIMLDVLIALLPTTVAGVVLFGSRAALVLAVCVIACVGFEALFNLLTKKPQTVGDLSAAVTGLLLGLNLPSTLPLWQCAVGALFAIIIVKCLFGGIGHNLVNPAITARVFMLVAFGAAMQSNAINYPTPTGVDAVSGATPLDAKAPAYSLMDLFLGKHGGSIGEVCAAALLLGGIYLIVRRVITWQVPVTFVGTAFIFSFLMEGYNVTSATAAILSGGLLIGAFFMATDYVTSPPTAWGKVIFGIGCGLITCLIRYFGSVEGVSYAILFMNILNPYICKWTQHKVFGTGGAH